MDKMDYQGQHIPIFTKSGAQGDLTEKNPNGDKPSPGNAQAFVNHNVELQGAISSQPESSRMDNGEQSPLEDVRKSTLVEIPTPTSRVLYKINAIFPFDIVPDSLVVDELKVSFIYRDILYKKVNNILIKDITDVLVSNNPLFGAIQINGGDYEGTTSSTNPDEKGPLIINHLVVREAYIARRIILGLMIFNDEKVDTSKMPVPVLIEKTEALGKAREM